jgi:opacity protein-like surface antigen
MVLEHRERTVVSCRASFDQHLLSGIALACTLLAAAPAAAQNRVVNPHFAGDLSGWQDTGTFGTSSATYDSSRSATSDGTGSVASVVRTSISPGFANGFWPVQCIGGIVAGQAYDFGGAVLIPSVQPDTPNFGNGYYSIGWSPNADCSGASLSGDASTPGLGDSFGTPRDTWATTQARATAPSGAVSVKIVCRLDNLSGPSKSFQVNFDDVFFAPVPAPPPPNGLCYLDGACSAGNQQSARDSGSGLCTPVASCSELWKCALGPSTRSCGGGSQDCAFSPDCAEGVSSCAGGSCQALATCNDRIRFQGYAPSPGPNQCSCAGNPAAPGCTEPPACAPDSQTLCLNGGRFKVQASFDAGGGNSGTAHAVGLTADTGYFWFFDAANVEVVIKVINGCALNQRYWVFAGGLTNVEVTLSVIDTAFGGSLVQHYQNPASTAFQPIQDTSAFATCP